ncbi:knob-associated histidine-rich protein-like [Rhipicephalus sanguineus]|uniref:knob-associated histidine-rich protein-like n=1 Tax=Rhipicephalus sanguineus TaxID=34632 RepID=UPI0020C4FB7B|nr:knob-associated histidine-rich protein-like [Rhipicephalus sanguineus]
MQIHVGGQASGDAGHRQHHKNVQHHPHQQPPTAAANAGRKQQHTEQVQGNGQGSDDAGHRQHQIPVQQQPQQPPATNMINKPHTSEQPHAPCRGGARAKKKRKGGKPTCS